MREWRSCEAHARIDEGVEQIREEIDDYVGNRDYQDAPLEQRVVAGRDGLYGEAADAGPGKDCFCDDGAGEERAELQAEDGNYGNQGVAEGMAEEYGDSA